MLRNKHNIWINEVFVEHLLSDSYKAGEGSTGW